MIETVKKLNWAPDIIHVNGWMASLLPLYLKEYFKTEPLFKESKIVTSIYNQSFDGTLDKNMKQKISFDGLEEDTIKMLDEPSYLNLMKVAIDNSDAIIKGSAELDSELSSYFDAADKPKLDYFSIEEFTEPYTEFYNNEVLG